MRVISNRKLREFWQIHPNAYNALMDWRAIARKATWTRFEDVRVDFGKRVDRVGRLLVFDIGGNKFRLIGFIRFDKQRLYIRSILTHAEYDRGFWKED